MLTLGLLGGGLTAVQAAAPGPSLELQAPSSVNVDEPIQITLAVRNAADVAGYETRLRFDPRAAEFDGLARAPE